MPVWDLLFNFLVRGVRAWVEDASGQVVDEANALGNADLLLLCQLASQSTLSWGGMVHWHRLAALLQKEEQSTACVIYEGGFFIKRRRTQRPATDSPPPTGQYVRTWRANETERHGLLGTTYLPNISKILWTMLNKNIYTSFFGVTPNSALIEELYLLTIVYIKLADK